MRQGTQASFSEIRGFPQITQVRPFTGLIDKRQLSHRLYFSSSVVDKAQLQMAQNAGNR